MNLLLALALLLCVCLSAWSVSRFRRARSDLERLRRLAVDGYESVRAQSEETAMLRHDMKKHLNVANTLLSEGRTADAQAYLTEVSGAVAELPALLSTGNAMIDLIFNSAFAAARESGVRVIIAQAEVPASLPLTDTELTSLLMNALDNAIHAAKRSERWLSVDLHRKEHMFYIGITNPCPPGEDRSTQGSGHGYGLNIMRRIVERRYGVMEAGREGGRYTVSLLLPEKEIEDGQ